jgi:hypothetical protein
MLPNMSASAYAVIEDFTDGQQSRSERIGVSPAEHRAL